MPIVSSWIAAALSTLGAPDALHTITERLFHLGNSSKPEWREFTSVEAEHPRRKDIEFEAAEKARVSKEVRDKISQSRHRKPVKR